VVKAGVLTVVLVVGASAAFAQPPARTPDAETIRARQKISIIEGALERAVQNGAANFARRLQAVAPTADGMAMLMGAPVVRGFPLPGLGVFFDVSMPSLQLSMMWPLRITSQESALGRRGPAATVANLQSATITAEPAASADTAILDDPADVWRGEVRAALIDAMIENTMGVTVKPDEYLVVAARGMMSPDRLSDPGETRTIELRLKGSDLLAARANTITMEEARKKVEVREY
jgi:hypothetical protein